MPSPEMLLHILDSPYTFPLRGAVLMCDVSPRSCAREHLEPKSKAGWRVLKYMGQGNTGPHSKDSQHGAGLGLTVAGTSPAVPLETQGVWLSTLRDLRAWSRCQNVAVNKAWAGGLGAQQTSRGWLQLTRRLGHGLVGLRLRGECGKGEEEQDTKNRARRGRAV